MSSNKKKRFHCVKPCVDDIFVYLIEPIYPCCPPANSPTPNVIAQARTLRRRCTHCAAHRSARLDAYMSPELQRQDASLCAAILDALRWTAPAHFQVGSDWCPQNSPQLKTCAGRCRAVLCAVLCDAVPYTREINTGTHTHTRAT